MAPEHAVKEAVYLEELRKAFGSRRDVRIWRQLTGHFWTRFGDDDFRPVNAGPPNGAADLSGLVIGNGKRLEIEVKGPGGKLRKEQETFRDNIIRWGGVYLLCQYDDSQSMEENVAREMQRLTALVEAA